MISQSLKCYINSHNYEITEILDVKDKMDNLIGKVFISRCKHCGKIKAKTIYTKTDCYGNLKR